MEDIKNHLKDISEMRQLMAQSAKFLSLSGLSGVSAGICALLGAGVAWIYFGGQLDYRRGEISGDLDLDLVTFFLLDAGLVLAAALASASFFSVRLAKRKGYPVWNRTAWHILEGLAIPLAAGGCFCLIQLSYGVWGWIAPTTLIFYGLALLNAGKYTVNEIRWLGISEVILGLVGAWFIGWGLYLWALGFGVLHIVYGVAMYMKYER